MIPAPSEHQFDDRGARQGRGGPTSTAGTLTAWRRWTVDRRREHVRGFDGRHGPAAVREPGPPRGRRSYRRVSHVGVTTRTVHLSGAVGREDSIGVLVGPVWPWPHRRWASRPIRRPAPLGSASSFPLPSGSPWRGQGFGQLSSSPDAHVRLSLAGFVSDDDLEGLYGMADLVVVLSVAEGFGLPVLEAMVRG
ncbi:MAG: glycosyltransferase [Acidimicrobiales bacterium]